MTRSKQQLSKQLKQFQYANSFTDKDVASMLNVSTLTVFRLRRGLYEWVEFGLFRKLVNIMGE